MLKTIYWWSVIIYITGFVALAFSAVSRLNTNGEAIDTIINSSPKDNKNWIPVIMAFIPIINLGFGIILWIGAFNTELLDEALRDILDKL